MKVDNHYQSEIEGIFGVGDVVDKELTAKKLSEVLDAPYDYILQRLEREGVYQVEFGYYGSKLTELEKLAIEDLELPGLDFIESSKRFYPNGTFASYMTNNFQNLDSDGNGTISAAEIQNLMSQMATQGLTREQIIALAGSSGVSTSLQETVLSHFDQIDKNKDGKVTNQEIQAYGVDSDVEKQKLADSSNTINT